MPLSPKPTASPAKRAVLMIAASSALLASCASITDLPTERLGQARLTLANGIPAGTAQLLADGDSLSLVVAVTGLSEGTHGFHLHTVGKCEAPAFTSAGGHLNPFDKTHGALSPDGKHLGDLPNLDVRANGSATATFDIDGSRSAILDEIFDADGTAVMIHAGPDDYRSDPAGDAGSRIACGVLKSS